MINVRGVWLPDADTHFRDYLRTSPLVNGKATYQLPKIYGALEMTPPDRRGLALDIGCHIGTWSMILWEYFSRVVAFEPIAAHRECFEANLAGTGNVDLWPYAVGAVTAYVSLATPRDNSGNACIALEGERASMTRIDDSVFPGRIDFIKVDTEGYELPALRGAENTIKRDRPTIVIEQKPGNAERYGFEQHGALNLLKAWGMQVAWEKSGDWCMIWP